MGLYQIFSEVQKKTFSGNLSVCGVRKKYQTAKYLKAVVK
jgi:hypothetical protein